MNSRERIVFLSSFIGVASTLALSIRINSNSIIVFTLINIWFLIKFKSLNKEYIIFFLIHFFFFVVFLIGLIYTQNIRSAGKLFEARFPLLLFPLLLLLTGKLWDKRMLQMVLLGFAFSIIACGLFIQGALFIDLIRTEKSVSEFFYWKMSGSDLSERIGIHPTYLSMYAIFSLSIIYEIILVGQKKVIIKILAYLAMTYLIVLTLHLSSRISLFSLLLIVMIILYHMYQLFSYRVIVIISPLLILICLLFSLAKFSIKSRLENNVGLTLGILSGKTIPGDSTKYDQRTYAWYSSMKIVRNHFLEGVGSGDVNDSLNSHYIKLNAKGLAEVNLNSHNQYFDSIMRNGIMGLIALLILYFYGVYKIKFKRLYLSLVLIVVITSLTENILERQKGTCFYAVFSSLLFAYYREDSRTSDAVSKLT